MGKEWLFWGGKANKKSGKSAGRKEAVAAAEVAAPTGCMCAVLQMFDLHQFQLALNHQPSFRQAAGPLFHDETYIPNPGKGVEAPRNSLELDEHLVTESDSSSSSTRGKQQPSLNIPAVTIQIRTPRPSDVYSDSCSGADSPAAGGNKTPTLVARLMGLDQLPPGGSASTSTTPSSSAHRLQNRSQNRSSSHRSFFDSDARAGSGTLSLPETPRVSSARRSDVDNGHRHSLQINKENIEEAVKHMARKRSQLIKQADQEEHRRSGTGPGPSEYAKEIVKQFKENVGRKVALVDITNTIKTRDHQNHNYTRRDDHVVLLKPNKPSSKVSSSPSSPKLPVAGGPGKVNLEPNPQVLRIRDDQKQKNCKKDEGKERYRQVHDPILKKKEEPFIRPGAAQKGSNGAEKKCKKTDIFNISVPTLLPVKKHQSQASSSDGEQWKRSTQHQQKQPLNSQENILERRHRTAAATTCGQVVELEYRHYIQRILKRAGLEKSTPVSSAKWFDPAHPLDPSIFHYIELFHPVGPTGGGVSELGLRCNRKLVFQAVDELLVDILRKPRGEMYGSDLMDSLWTRIENFPRADCKVLEDIDALLATDFRKTAFSLHADYGEEEGDEIVEEIQREIVKSLVHDATLDMIKGDYKKRLAASGGGGGG